MEDINWPDGATHKIDSDFTKWVGGDEYIFKEGQWVKEQRKFDLCDYEGCGKFEIIERPIEINWPDDCYYQIGGFFTKWIGGTEYSFEDNEWVRDVEGWSLEQYGKSGRGFTIIARPKVIPNQELSELIPVIANENKLVKVIPKIEFKEMKGTEVMRLCPSVAHAGIHNSFNNKQFVELINEMHGQGWEFVQILALHMQEPRLIFKREVMS